MKYNPLNLRITWKTVAYYIVVVMAYFMWFMSLYNLIAHQTVLPYKDPVVYFTVLGLNLAPMFCIFLSNTFVVFFTPAAARRSRLTKVVLDIVCSMAFAFLVYYIYEQILRMFTPNYYINWGAVVVNNLMIFLINEVVYYFVETKQNVKEIERAKRTTLQMRYDVLKAQINPHFLFNSLNNLYSLIEVDKSRAMEFTISLSQTYRYIMSQQDKPTVLLREEMKFAEAYINVLRIRYNNNFSVEVSGRENIADHEIIPYSLQLLIENVAKHNIIGTHYPMKVLIDITPTEVRIVNPVRRKNVMSDTRIGLQYLTELYALHGLEFRHGEENGLFTAIIPYLK